MNIDILPQEGVILCAVSGGADSMYLLCRLSELGYPVAAAHFNHGLRGAEADRDEAFVRRFCEDRDIPFTSEKADAAAYAAQHRVGVEEAARTLRYTFLEKAADALSAEVIATAHTADDNAETILMRLARGAGLHGLGGIPPVRGRIVRPMLETSRAEVETYLREHNIPHVEDSTNAEDAYMRNRIRHTVIPALREENPAFTAAVSRTASLLRRDEEYLEEITGRFLAENADETSIRASALCGQPWPVASRAIRRMAGPVSAEQTEAILRAAREGGMVDVTGMRVGKTGDRLVFDAAAWETIKPRLLAPGEAFLIPEAGLFVRCEKIAAASAVVYNSFNTFFFPCANIYGNIYVNSRRPGDRLRLPGRGCTKTLKSLFQERNIPAWERNAVPVLRDDVGLLGVYGIGPAERAIVGAGENGDALKIEFIRL